MDIESEFADDDDYYYYEFIAHVTYVRASEAAFHGLTEKEAVIPKK